MPHALASSSGVKAVVTLLDVVRWFGTTPPA
jgi:hypothetical protein